MSINIQAKTNYSFLFSGLSSSASNALSGNWLADYASIKNGSYGKLMKAYYAKDSGDLGLCFIMILPQPSDDERGLHNVTTLLNYFMAVSVS